MTKSRRPEDLSPEDLLEIERLRRSKPQLQRMEGKEYGLYCPVCDKPNNLKQLFCTGCSFQLDPVADMAQLPDNIFMDILLGKTDTQILYEDEQFAVFDDKFPIAKHHIEVIPKRVIEDITHLTKDDIPLVENMFQCALEELRRREDVQARFDVERLQESLVAGFNFPVSVKHLHLHAVLPPFKHKKVFVYPRWHSYEKVLRELKQQGRVTTYEELPVDEEGHEEYSRAMRLHQEHGGT